VPFDVGCEFDVEQEAARGRELHGTLNEKQLEAYNFVYNAVQDSSTVQTCFFLDGPGGAGKTYLYETLIATLRGEGKTVLPVASTGIAANLLPNGRTYHSQYKLPIPILSNSVSNVKTGSKDATVIRNASLLIWDEVTMASVHALNCVDRLLKEIMGNDRPFGGKVLVLGGDFRQCLPIVPRANKAGILEECIKQSFLWNGFKILTLLTNQRSVDPAYSSWILDVGNGKKMNEVELEDDIVEIPADLLSEDLIGEIYGESIAIENIQDLVDKAILSPKNDTVAFLNSKILDLLPGHSKIYLSNDKIEHATLEDATNYPIEFLNGLNPSGMPPHELKLKIGAIIMLLRNLNTKLGLCNGTRMVVKDLKQNLFLG
jgi:ATP-dependent DNA helicase PIF1